MIGTLTALAAAAALAPGHCATQGGAGTPYATGVNCRVIAVDGYPRQFLVYVPRRRPVNAPLVFMFHGSSGDGERFLRISGWREQADATGLVAVFPTGLRYRVIESGRRVTKWNGYNLPPQVTDEKPPGYPEGAPWPADDVGFTDAMLSDLEAQLPIDPRRVYASGFSNGAEFTARLAVERSTVLGAAAFSGGGLYTTREPERPIPMYLTVGSLDDRVLAQTDLDALPRDPFALLAVPPVAAMVDANLDTLGLAHRPFGVISARRSTSLRWPPAGDPVFRFSVIAGLGHQYPEGAARKFWSFFRAHPLPAVRASSSTG